MLGKKIGLAGILVFCFAVCLSAQDDNRVSATWKILKYDLAVTLPQNESERALAVIAKLDVRNVSARPASTITLRISQSADVSAVNVNGTPHETLKREEKTGTGSLQQIVVRMPAVAPNGNVLVAVTYRLGLKDNSGLASISSTGSQFLPLSFWYPTPNSWFFARGADYAPTRLTLAAPAGMTVVAPGTSNGSSFETGLNIQPFFVAGSWDTQNLNGISIYFPKGADVTAQHRASELAAVLSEARSYLESFLGEAPQVPIKAISVRRGTGFSSGGTVLFDDAVLRRPKLDSQTVLSIVEGVAKTWLGGSVSIYGDGNGAIREGLPRFLATQFIEHKYGKEVGDVERLRQRVAYVAVVGRDAPINTVSPLDDYYYSVVANKGAMIWRLLLQKTGQSEFSARLRSAFEDGTVSLAEIRGAFPVNKEFLDYAFDQTTDMNLLAGLPQQSTGEAKVALRNTGAVDVTVDVEAVLGNGQRMTASTTIRATSYGEVTFKTQAKIRRVEIDRQKLYPQTDFSDDVAPRELADSDPLLAVKRAFDRQQFAEAEKIANEVLADFPRHDDVRILLGRCLLAQNKSADAERQFSSVLDEKLPTSRSIAWALVGLADVALKSNQSERAAKLASDAIKSEGEYGAGLAARNIRNGAGVRSAPESSIVSFFEQWDRAAASNQKAQLDAMVFPGEASRFSGGVAGQTAAWKTEIRHVDMIDGTTALVETNLSIKLLNRDPESGMAVFRLGRTSGGWKISSVDVFEVR